MSKKDSHSGNPVVFEAQGIKVHAGGTNRSGGWHVMSPMPDVAMGPLGVMRSARTRDVMPQGWSCSDKVESGQVPVLFEIEWPDYNVPSNLGREWWLAFVEDVKSKGVKSISTQCMGGHGRTGVQLCILAHMLGAVKQPDAGSLIRWVRERYCEHAVEAPCQQDYIAEMCQIPVGESAITVQNHNPWGGQTYGDNFAFTEDEYQAQMKHQAKAKKKTANKGKKKKYDSPIRKHWSLTYCEESDNYEWRRTNPEHMEKPCRISGAEVVQADETLMEGMRLVPCLGTGRDWHPIEMATKEESNAHLAKEMGLEVKEEGYETTILINKTWHPTWWVKYHRGEFTSWFKYYETLTKKDEKKDKKSSSFKKEQRTLSEWDRDSEYEDYSYDPDDFRDEQKKESKRQTNEEIESEEWMI